MAAKSGRKVTIHWGGERVSSLRTKSLSINHEPIDVTSADDEGFRTLLEDDSGVSSMDLEVGGVLKVGSLMQDALVGGTRLFKEMVIAFDGFSDITCDMRLTAVSLEAPHEGAVEFTASFQSSGEWSDSTST